MDRPPLHRPRVSRETRQLLATVLLAVIALWVLGRVRYPDRSSANPVPALLTQLAPRPAFNELAAESAQLRSRLGASLLAVRSGDLAIPAFRIRDDTALAFAPRTSGGVAYAAALRDGGEGPDAPGADRPEPIVSDGATGMTLLRVTAAAAALAPAPWTPRELDEPRYLLATVASADDVALRPVFVAALEAVNSAAWSAPIWNVPGTPDLQPGSLLFTEEGELAGAVVAHRDGVAIVPAVTLLAEAHRLRQVPPRQPGFLGIDVQTLTPALAAATGASRGVVVAWVSRAGPADGHLRPGDVIEAADGRWLQTREHWDVRDARLAAGEPIVLGVRRRGEWHDVQLVAAVKPADARPLGLTLRGVPRIGSEIVAVDRPSAAADAGLEPGDLITLIAAVDAPTPAQGRDASAAAADGRPLLIVFSRGTAARVATLHR